MTGQMLTAAGIPNSPARFPDPPDGTYAVFFDEETREGPDPGTPPAGVGFPYICTHDCTVELYEATADDAAEEAFETQLTDRGLSWTKQARYWLPAVQRYQVIYEYGYLEKY